MLAGTLGRSRRGISGSPAAARSGETSSVSRAIRSLRIAACLLGAAFGAGIPAWNLAQPHKLYGISQYDDGVYLAGAMRLVAGHVPYREFAFVQPPGITLVLAPVALFGHFVGARLALGAARILVVVIAGANAALAGWIVRHRGAPAAAVASLALGAYPEAIEATHTILLEPFLVLFVLLAIAAAYSKGQLASGPRLVLCGVLLGIGTSVKLWGGVVALVILVGLWGRRDAFVRVLAGGLIAGAATCLPFFLAAPSAFWREVVVDQLTRGALGPSPSIERFDYLIGFPGLNFHPGLKGTFALPLLLAAVIAVLIVVAVVAPAIWRRSGRFELTVAGLAFCSSLLVFVSPEFYSHYVYFPAALDALALGLVAAGLADGVRALVGHRSSRLGVSLRAGFVALVLALLASVCGAAYVAEPNHVNVLIGADDIGARIAAYIPAGACVLTDTEIDLVAANRLAESPSCPTVVDATGQWLVDDPKHPAGSGAVPPALVATWQGWLSHSPYLLFTSFNAFRIPWTPELHRYVDTHFRIVAVEGAFIWVRRAHPISWNDVPVAIRRA